MFFLQGYAAICMTCTTYMTGMTGMTGTTGIIGSQSLQPIVTTCRAGGYCKRDRSACTAE